MQVITTRKAPQRRGPESQSDHAALDDTVVPLEIRRLAATYDIDLREVARGRPLGSLTRQMLIEFGREQMGLAHLEVTAIDRAPDRSSSPEIGKGDCFEAGFRGTCLSRAEGKW